MTTRQQLACAPDSVLTGALSDIELDTNDRPALAMRLDVTQNDAEQPPHRHRKGQLVVALGGAVTCHVPGALWLVPPLCGVWVPAGVPHSNRVTHNARLGFLFVEPGAARMPATCCTLGLSPLLRELILHLADQPADYPPRGPVARLVAVLLEQLAASPVEQLHLPMSGHPKIERIAQALRHDPSDRTTLAQWAARLATTDRSLARLFERETGMGFGRWRQQLHLLVALHQLAAGQAVQQVAGHLGYDSVTAFITMFKKALGQPPGQYMAGRR